MGNGLKASFKFENGLGLNGTNLLAANSGVWNNVSSGNREAWVGLSGDIGNLQVGFQYAPVFNTAVGTDPNGANNVAGWSPFTVIFGNGGGNVIGCDGLWSA
ncbi:MAG: porin [Alphaproteobacteria bacterium]|nr:porin [Alphaproteobacteria bacterium]